MSELKEHLAANRGRRSTRGHVRRTKQSMPWWIVVIVAIIGIIGVWGLVQIFLPGVQDTELSDYHNRAWLGAGNWTQTEPNRTQVEAMVDRLHENNIDMIYVEAGFWDPTDLSYVEHNFAEQFREMVHEIDPDMKVLVWIYIEQRDLYTNSSSRINYISFAERAMRDWDYDGVHLQAYDVVDESESFVQFVRSLDTVADDQGGLLSISVPPDYRPADPGVPVAFGNPTTSWSPRYKQQLAFIVDEMVVRPYGSGLKDSDDYKEWFAYQVKIYADAAHSVNDDVDIIIALATDDTEEDIENFENALSAAQDGVTEAGSNRNLVRGAGIYYYDVTTSQDWVLFYEEWVKK